MSKKIEESLLVIEESVDDIHEILCDFQSKFGDILQESILCDLKTAINAVVEIKDSVENIVDELDSPDSSEEKDEEKDEEKEEEEEKITSVHPDLDPEKIFERGFVTEAESKKVDLSSLGHKVELVDQDGEREDIWAALLTEEDVRKYNGVSYGKEIRCVLLNDAVAFFPYHTWGRVLVGKTNGSRPIFKAVDQVERLKSTHAAYLAEYSHGPQ